MDLVSGNYPDRVVVGFQADDFSLSVDIQDNLLDL